MESYNSQGSKRERSRHVLPSPAAESPWDIDHPSPSPPSPFLKHSMYTNTHTQKTRTAKQEKEQPEYQQNNPLKQSLRQWLSTNNLPSQIYDVLVSNNIDTVELLSHCSNRLIDDISQLLRDKLPTICTCGELSPLRIRAEPPFFPR